MTEAKQKTDLEALQDRLTLAIAAGEAAAPTTNIAVNDCDLFDDIIADAENADDDGFLFGEDA